MVRPSGVVGDGGSRHQHTIRVVSEDNEVSGFFQVGAVCGILEVCIDGPKHSAFLSLFGSPVTKGNLDVKKLVMFPGVVGDEIGGPLGPFAFDLVKVTVVRDLGDVEDGKGEDATGLFTVSNKLLVNGGVS